MQCTEVPVSPSTPTADLVRNPVPMTPSPRDFSRLGAVVTLERYRVDSTSRWAPDDVAASLWACKDLMPFPSLANLAMGLAREPRIKTPGGIGLYMAGVIEL